MAITVKFLGALRHVSGVESLCLDYKENVCVRIVINELIEERPELSRSLIDHQVQDPRLNALMLVNGREISVLSGLDTVLQDGDVLVIIPVVHGG
jgi:MoaD family protein